MTSLELLPVHHPLLKWCTPDGLWLSDEEALGWTPLPPVSNEDGAWLAAGWRPRRGHS